MSTQMSLSPVELKKKVDDLNGMILEGKILDAFEKYYAKDCVMQEASDEPIVGKDANREREKTFVNGLTDLRSAELKSVAAGDGVTMSEWHFDFTHADWGDQTYDQVAVQKWNSEGKIVHERFYKV